MNKKKNKWKRYFFYLLIGNLIVISAIIGLIFWPISTDHEISDIQITEQDSSEFVVRTTKKNLNELVNAYIDKLLHGTKHHYRVLLEDDVHLVGELPVFSTTVPLSIHLE